MVKSVEGIYCEGKVELLEVPPQGAGRRVIVTFLYIPAAVNLVERGIGPPQAVDLRGRLASFAEDWSRSEMDVYDAL